MVKVIVKPMRQRGEILFLLISTVSIILVAWGLISLRSGKKEPKKLKKYQISAFVTLKDVDQNMFSELRLAGDEILYMHEINRETWPKVKELEINMIPPFTKDAVWVRSGRHKWYSVNLDDNNNHSIVYIGKVTQKDVAGSFMLVHTHYHGLDGAYAVGSEPTFKIWYKKGDFTVPSEIVEGTLIKSGWKEVVAYVGKDELKKLERAQ